MRIWSARGSVSSTASPVPGPGCFWIINWRKAGIPAESIGGYDQEVFTHIEVGLAVLSGEATRGLPRRRFRAMLGLDFIPVTRERFDMILDQSVFFQKGVQALMEVLNGELFRKRVEKSGRATTFKAPAGSSIAKS